LHFLSSRLAILLFVFDSFWLFPFQSFSFSRW
jgi:hypothetical protein